MWKENRNNYTVQSLGLIRAVQSLGLEAHIGLYVGDALAQSPKLFSSSINGPEEEVDHKRQGQ